MHTCTSLKANIANENKFTIDNARNRTSVFNELSLDVCFQWPKILFCENIHKNVMDG